MNDKTPPNPARPALIKLTPFKYRNRTRVIITARGNYITAIKLPSINSVKWRIQSFFWIYKSDVDCDGTAYTVADRLTNGWLYYKHEWHSREHYGRESDFIMICNRWFIHPHR